MAFFVLLKRPQKRPTCTDAPSAPTLRRLKGPPGLGSPACQRATSMNEGDSACATACLPWWFFFPPTARGCEGVTVEDGEDNGGSVSNGHCFSIPKGEFHRGVCWPLLRMLPRCIPGRRVEISQNHHLRPWGNFSSKTPPSLLLAVRDTKTMNRAL